MNKNLNNKGEIDLETVAIIGLIMLGLLVFGLIFLSIVGFGFPKSGSHSGFVTSVDQGGMFDKTIIYFKTNPQSSQEDVYCLLDSSLRDTLDEVQRNNERVTIDYSRGFFMPFWNCRGSDEVINKLERNK